MNSYVRYGCVLITLTLLTLMSTSCASSRSENLSFSLEPLRLEEVSRVLVSEPDNIAKPTIALVLGGGGLRGFAHLGVIMAITDLGIEPDIIVGTSAGAVVGAAFASGLTTQQIKAEALDIKIASLIDFTFSSGGIIRGHKLANWLDQITGEQQVEDLPLRFAAVATDLQSGNAVLLDKGSVGTVVQASSAVPGMNVPVPYSNGYLIDGGVSGLLPVRFARAMGADIVIAVEIYCSRVSFNELSIMAVVSRVMHTQSCQLATSEIAEADVLITPELSISSVSLKAEREHIIQIGYDAAFAAIEAWRLNDD